MRMRVNWPVIVRRWFTMSSNRLKLLDLFSLFLLGVLINRVMLSVGGVASWGDWPYLTNEYFLRRENIPTAWDGQFYLGWEDYALMSYPLYIFIKQLVLLGIDASLSLTILFFLFSSTMSGISMYFLQEHLNKDRIASLVSAIFYMLNPYVVWRFMAGQPTAVFTYAFLPLIILFCLKALKKSDLKCIFLAALVTSIATWSHSHPSVFVALAIMSFTVLFSVITSKSLVLAIRYIKSAVFILLLVFLLNAYWIFPIVLPSITLRGNISWASSAFPVEYLGSRFATLLEGYFMWVHHEWFLRYAEISPPYISWFIPLLVFLVPIFRRNKEALLFFSMALCGIFLGKGIKGPFGEAYVLLTNIPYFKGIRYPPWFFALLSLSYAFLIGVAAQSLGNLLAGLGRNKIPDSLRYMMRKYFPAVIVVVFIFMNSTQLLRGDYGGFLYEIDKRTVDKLGDIVPNNSDRIFFFSGSYNNFYEPIIAYLSEDDARINSRYVDGRSYYGTSSYGVYQGSTNLATFSISSMLRQRRDSSDLLGVANVKYIVVDPSIKSPYMGSENREIIKFLSNERNLIVKQIDGIYVFENKNYLPKIMVTDSNVLIANGPKSFLLLSSIDSFNISRNSVTSIEQISDKALYQRILSNSRIIFVDNDLDDFFFPFLSDYMIQIEDYSENSYQFRSKWVKSSAVQYNLLTEQGEMAYANMYALTEGAAEIEVPLEVRSVGEHEIYLRLDYGMDKGHLLVFLDDKLISTLQPSSNESAGFRWVHLGDFDLYQKRHQLKFVNLGDGGNDLDAAVVVPKPRLSELRDEFDNILMSRKIVVVYSLGDVNNFEVDTDVSEDYAVLGDDYFKKIVIPYDSIISFWQDDEEAKANCLEIGIDGIRLSTKCLDPRREGLAEIGSINVSAGSYTMEITSRIGHISKDIFLVLDNEQRSMRELLKGNQGKYSFRQVNPNEYSVYIEANGPSFIVLNENYHPAWQLQTSGKVEFSFPSFFFANGYLIENRENFEARIKFLEQDQVLTGGAISLITAIAFPLLILYKKRKNGSRCCGTQISVNIASPLNESTT